MLASASYREPRNGKTYNTRPERTMSEKGSDEGNVAEFSSKNVEGEIPGTNTPTQEEVIEQIKGFIFLPPQHVN